MCEFFARDDARTGRQAAGETAGDARADAATAHRAPRAHIAAARTVGARCAAGRHPGRRILPVGTARRGTASKNTPTTSARITTVPHGKCGAGAAAPRKPPPDWPSSAFNARTDWGFSFGSPGSSSSARLSSERASDSLALLGVQLCLDVMGFGALRMIAQHLIHHLLCLIEVARGGRLVNLMHGRIGIRRPQRPGRDGESQDRGGKGMQQGNVA